jgi:putative nucleotidyltransferase with HDIG domain
MAEENKIDILTYFKIINRPRVTKILLALSLAATLLIGASLYSQGYATPGLILGGFSLVSGVLLIFSYLGYYQGAAHGLVSLFPLLLAILMIDGEGLHDPGMLGFPIYIIFSTLLLGKKSLPRIWLVTLLMVIIVFLFEYFGLVPWTADLLYHASLADLFTVVIILSVGSAIFWVIMNIIEASIVKVIAGENQIKEAYDLTLEGWAKALEMRDKETEGHSRRVTELTLRICDRMGFTDEEIFHIRRGALLHDIGKMAIPDSILHKPSSLDKAEWKVVKEHPDQAYQMLKTIEFLTPALEIPLYHHEHWDGAGYPFGLVGDQIPLPARIFSIVDNWDALLSDRPYRSAWSRQQVMDYIKEESGKKFDPQVVETFLSVIKDHQP